MITCLVISNGITLFLAICLVLSEWMARNEKIKENSIHQFILHILRAYFKKTADKGDA
jgi:hypothetical protein